MAQGGYEFEVRSQREAAGNGPVVRYQVQEDRGVSHDGQRCWYTWTDTDDFDDATHSLASVRGFARKQVSDCIRLVKITTEIMDA